MVTSIPVMRLGTTLLTALSDGTDDSAARNLVARILSEAGRSRTCGVAVDISSLEIVHPSMGVVVRDIVGCVSALGARAFLCGGRPEVLRALIDYGVDAQAVTFVSDTVEAITQSEDV